MGTTQICAILTVDINGQKKPNQFGRDIFGFALKEHGLYPLGCEADWCDKTVDGDDHGRGSGWGCACKVLREGAINY